MFSIVKSNGLTNSSNMFSVRNDERYRRESVCVSVKGTGHPGVQSEWVVGTTCRVRAGPLCHTHTPPRWHKPQHTREHLLRRQRISSVFPRTGVTSTQWFFVVVHVDCDNTDTKQLWSLLPLVFESDWEIQLGEKTCDYVLPLPCQGISQGLLTRILVCIQCIHTLVLNIKLTCDTQRQKHTFTHLHEVWRTC
jgi:hypothetical protein